ncbi:hypothetical protein A943_04190 [Bacillus sp. CPSM8]|uniref:hypothetical protein n=1 Tax=Bacillus TaxID=1386 RepID=UPI0003A8B6BB|nr:MULTISPECIES: hypothetical protein [Bacillus]ETB72601.1 hypothetical protein A943_04190 [Bacillus sp. CPSM8]MBX9436284.1 hypothetical protein [Bacillus paralicheniformis]MCY1631344.1 hypothetical protein [Bacillus paralicheniformis]MDE1384599.1 hypothetical protein [Bacillus paralicheniformis]TAI50156.1 hypothetical protein CXP52_21440 [Bacillus paralicheniformis]
MSYLSLESIKAEFKLDDSKLNKAKDVLNHLRPSDTLTTGVFARKTDLTFEKSQDILISMVNKGLLDVVIYVPCSEDEEDHPYLIFTSLKDYFKASFKENEHNCSFCECHYDFHKAIVAFKRPKKQNKGGFLNDKKQI